MWGKAKIAAALAAAAAVASGSRLASSDNAAAALPKVYEDHHHYDKLHDYYQRSGLTFSEPKFKSDLHDYELHANGRKNMPWYSAEDDFPRASAEFGKPMQENAVGFRRYLDRDVRDDEMTLPYGVEPDPLNDNIAVLEQDDSGEYTVELINTERRPSGAFGAQGDVMQEVTKEYADRFLASSRKIEEQIAKRSENRAYCAGSEGSGIDPSCGGGGGSGSSSGKTAQLPQDHGKYFTKVVASSAKYDEVPIGALDAIRARPDGIANANKFMREAYEGKNSPREPISVVKSGDRYKVMDGNSSFANAKKAGWTTMPVQVFKTEEDAKAHEKQTNEAKEEAKKKAAKRAYPRAQN